MLTLFRLFPAAGLIFLAGCVMPKSAYRQVDQSTPAFKEAVAQETTRQQAGGKTAAQAEKRARYNVTEQFIEAEKDRRTKQVAPLIQALTAFEQPRGCWAYTATTTTSTDGKITVQVEHYDPFQPEAKLWTLVSRNGEAPDEAAQAAYRQKKAKAAKKAARFKEPKYSESVGLTALYSHFEIAAPATTTPTTFIFTRDRSKIPMLGDMPGSRTTYTVDNQVLTQRTYKDAGPVSMLGGTMKVDYFDSLTDYLVVDPSLAPFVRRTTVHLRMRFLGTDTGDIDEETMYTDYRRVKCYDDRFETSVGTPNLMDFIPDRN